MKIKFTFLHYLPRFLISRLFFLLLTLISNAQVPAVDSMGANMGRQNWKAAIFWALKAGEAIPDDKYWRYMNAAEFASRDHNAELAFEYLSYVVASDIATNVSYESEAFNWLHQDKRWIAVMDKVNKAHEQERKERIAASKPFRLLQARFLEADAEEMAALRNISSATQLYKRLKELRHQSIPPLHGRYQYAWLRWNDSIEVPYMVQLPPAFNSRKSYAAIVVLHGAVRMNHSLPDVPDSNNFFFGQNFMKMAGKSNMIAILPYSSRKYNWMVPDSGFNLVPDVINAVKKMYNIDDSRIYVTGHSNGATGAFSYLLKAPNLFAGFSGLNNRPQIHTGGTFIKNAQNRSFYNVATDYDYYFPAEGHQALQALTQKLKIDWKNTEVIGKRTHGYLISVEDTVTNQVYQNLFTYLKSKRRHSYKKHLYWETDDIEHGRCDWLEITSLDTFVTPASWHLPVNFTVSWRNPEEPSAVTDTSNAFEFPRRSGAVEAFYNNNKFILKTSRVKRVTIYISPEMVNINQPIRVIINGKTVYDKKVYLDRNFILENFKKQHDHQAL